MRVSKGRNGDCDEGQSLGFCLHLKDKWRKKKELKKLN